MQMPALAMTDHGNVFGAYDFWKKAKAAGVKPIIGTEAYLTPGTHRSDKTRVRWNDGGDDDVSGGGAYTHMTMWAENTAGMHNLFRLSSLASLEGQYYKPRMDRELLQTYSQGLIATTGCPGGEVQTLLRIGRYDDAVRSAAEFRDIFGAGNFYCEVMDHGLPIEQRVKADLLRLAKDLGLPLVATNDLHYTFPQDARGARRPALRAVGVDAGRPQALQVRGRGLLPQVGGGDAPHLGRAPRGLRQHPGHRRALRGRLHRGRQPHAALRGAAGGVRGVLAGQGGRGRPPAPVRRHGGRRPRGPPQAGRVRGRGDGPDGLPRLLPGHGRPGAAREGRTASGSARAAAAPPAAWWPTPWASPTSTRSGTGCCSSGSSTPSASRCPTSTSTSTSAGAAT